MDTRRPLVEISGVCFVRQEGSQHLFTYLFIFHSVECLLPLQGGWAVQQYWLCSNMCLFQIFQI